MVCRLEALAGESPLGALIRRLAETNRMWQGL
jgi:hypothetical protein